MKLFRLVLILSGLAIAGNSVAADPLRVLLIDGESPYHDWKKTTPVIRQVLENSGRFEVTVMTAPQDEAKMQDFNPTFADFDVFLSNYNGLSWNERTRQAFEKYIASGGGFVSVHSADNAFPDWPAYNRMIGLGGWRDRDESDGPYFRWKEDLQRFTRDHSPGEGGAHGKRVPFRIIVRQSDHPITRGIPSSFLQVEDELYAKLRGPAQNLHVLATAYADPETGGTGEHEPILMTIHYGAGRIFHTTLGHDVTAMKGSAFQVTLLRGTEWAATGKVTLPDVDSDVLSDDAAVSIDPTGDGTAADESDEGGSKSSDQPDIDGDGWVRIFNGKDKTGWSQRNGTATYRIDDGAVVGKTAKGSPNSFLCTQRDYGDFELTFEVKVDAGLNSGVQIRSRTKPETKRVYGPQVEIEQAPGESGYIYGEATGRKWLTKEQPIKDAYQNGKWNRFVVRAKGNRIQTWINGRAIADLRDPESHPSGFIGLQVHSIKDDRGPFEVRWRDIRVREL